LRFFGQILHLQWPAQTSKMGLGPLGVKERIYFLFYCNDNIFLKHYNL
jgi:hypothetical protein